MFKHRSNLKYFLCAVLIASIYLSVPHAYSMSASDGASQTVTIDGNTQGRTFGGVGALSAGGSSRLLYDYPEPERSQLLDYLFKPGYGASLQILKVEIGADVNSTSGSEPSHMREPDQVNCKRGYEWWLMKEAKERNPDIKLAALAWGAPGWARADDGTPDGGFYSEETIDYYLSWMGCAEQHGLQIDYLGGWNERGYDTDWYIDLDKALEERYPDVEIIAADDCCSENIWRVADSMAADPAFKDAVDIVGVHFACGHRSQYRDCSSTDTARELGKPLWMSENAAESHDVGAGPIARALNRMYIDAEMSAYISWSLISAWYANLPIADSGLMLAEWPWSGFYGIGSSIWANAHTTQFTEPGWHYLDTGSGRLDSGASYVSLASPSGDDYSTIVEAMDVEELTRVRFELKNLPEQELQVWTSDFSSGDQADYFQHAGTITPMNGAFEITLQPGHVYSISTRTDAGHGTSRPDASVHEQLKVPFHENFDNLQPGELARFFSDINGGFEAAPCGVGRDGTCYRQTITNQPVVWNNAGFLPPTTMVGDPRWWGDYSLRSKVMLEQPGFVELIGRVTGQSGEKVGGYHFQMGTEGWELYSEDSATGSRTTLASGDERIEPGNWHDLTLQMRGNQISAFLDGERLTHVKDTTQRAGNVALQTSKWVNAQFDDVSVTPTAPLPVLVPKNQMSASASSSHGFYRGYDYDVGNVIDDRPETLWHSKFNPRVPPPHTLTLDLGENRDIMAVLVRPRFEETSAMITDFEVQVSQDGRSFLTVARGSWPTTASTKVASWQERTKARYVRLVARNGEKGLASVAEMDVVTKWPGPGAPNPNPSPVPREQMSATATSFQDDYEPANAVDGNTASIWHTKFRPHEPLPQAITIGLGGHYSINEVTYLPRQDGNSNGTIKKYSLYSKPLKVLTDSLQLQK